MIIIFSKKLQHVGSVPSQVPSIQVCSVSPAVSRYPSSHVYVNLMPSGYGPSAGEYVPSVVANGYSHRAAGKILCSFLAHGFGVDYADILYILK